MSALNLSFRQKRILYTLQYASGPVTGSALSKALHVTTRTISSDIRVINQVLVPLHASIIPVKSHGYLYQADDPELLKSMNRFNDAFLTRENRIRYLAARLAFSDEPINLYDLEDEMFVSSTTLHHDIAGLKERCFNGSPHIRIITKKNKISFEESELKRRYILNQMYFQDWDYQSKGNSYYYFDYLDDDLLDLIIVTNCSALYENGIRIEDPCLVSLHIAAAIMCKRVKAGHNLDEVPAVQSVSDEAAMSASRMIVERLSSRLDLSFNEAEVIHLYERIASGHLFPAGSITALTEKDLLDEKVIRTARDFLDQINCLFHIDLSADEDFYITLLQYIDFIRRPVYVFNYQFDSELIKNRYSVELEMALLFLEPALYNLNCRIGKAALLYLADMLSGALDNFFNIHPEFKINVATCCHLNLPSIWALKRRLMSSFGTYLNLVAMFPVNASNIYDFSGINLIISTVSRELLHHPEIDTIIISPFLPDNDKARISDYIHDKRIRSLCTKPFNIKDLLTKAFWHEDVEAESVKQAIHILSSDFIQNGIAPFELETDLLGRESVISFACRQDIVFLHSSIPAAETRLSIVVFRHRLTWGGYRIRVAILAVFCEGEYDLLVHMLHTFYTAHSDTETWHSNISRQELTDYYISCSDQ